MTIYHGICLDFNLFMSTCSLFGFEYAQPMIYKSMWSVRAKAVLNLIHLSAMLSHNHELHNVFTVHIQAFVLKNIVIIIYIMD